MNYLTVEGFVLQDFRTSSASEVPVGVLIAGSGKGINLLNNTIKNIQTTAGKNGNAYGIGVFGTSATPLSVTVSGNTVTGCLTGESETTTYNGNVQNFVVSNNTIYDNDNIGMDAIGFEQVGPTGFDQAMWRCLRQPDLQQQRQGQSRRGTTVRPGWPVLRWLHERDLRAQYTVWQRPRDRGHQ